MRKNTIKLGLMPPLTGLAEMYGTEITRAGQIACDEVNENGGVLGKPLELIIEDDGSLPESAVEAATKLVDHHRCVALIGNLLSNSRIAVAYQVVEPRRIPYLNFSFYEGSILSHYFFHFAALPNQQIDLMIPYMRKRYGPRMFFAGNNYEWPRGSIDAAKRALEQAGGLTVGEEYYPIGVGDGDIERLLDQVAESGAEVFVPYFAGADQTHLLTRFTARGLKKRMAVVMGHYDEVMASRLPPEVREGFYSSNTYFMTLDTPENRTYLARLATQPGVDGIWPQGNGILTNFGEGAYLCVKAFANAANQAGSLDAEALIDALKTIAVSGPQGAVQMDPVSHHARVNTCLSRCEADGSFTIIERFGAIAPVLPERYRHLRISKQTGQEDIYLQSRMMAQITEAVLLVHATDGAIVYANPGAEQMFGYRSEELSGKRFSVLFAPTGKSPEEATAAIGKVLFRKGGWQGETENITRDGTRFWCAASVSVFTHPEFGEVWMILNRDITERKQAEEQLRASEALLRRTQSLAAIGSWRLNVPQNELVWTAETYRIFGIPATTPLTYESFLANVHPDDKELVNSAWQAALKGAPYRIQHRIVVRGKTRWVEERAELDFDARGNLRSGTGSVQDITERKQSEEALRLSEARFRRLVKVAPIPLCYVAKGGVIQDFNDRFAQVFGYTHEDIPTLDEWWQLAYPDADYRRWVLATWNAAVQAAAESGQDIRPVEYNVTCKNGEVRTMEISGVTLGEDFLATFIDLTSRKRAEEALRSREAQLKEAQHIARIGSWDWDATTDTITWTEELYRIFDRDPSLPTPNYEEHLKLYTPESSERLNAAVGRAMKTGESYELDLERANTDEHRKWIIARGEAIRDQSGRIVRLRGTAQDISERKNAEEKRRELEFIIEHSPTVTFLWKNAPGWPVEYVSNNIRQFGYTPEDFYSGRVPFASIIHPDDLQHVADEIAAYSIEPGREEFSQEYRIFSATGEICWLDDRTWMRRDKAGAITHYQGIVINITERKRAEERNRYLAAIVESSDDAIIGKSLGGVITSWNEGAEKMYGYTASEAVGQPISLLIPAEHQDELPQILEAIKAGKHVKHFETIRRKKDGGVINVSLSISPICDSDGNNIGAASVARDITERKRAEEELRAASLYARSLIEASLDPLVTISAEGKITDVNKATEEATGLSRSELTGTDFADYFTEPEKARSGYRQVFDQGFVRDYPLTLRHRAGHQIDVLYNATVYRDEAGNILGVFAAARDITERKRAEEAIRISQSRFSTIFKQAPLGIALIDSVTGRIYEVNPRFAEIAGRTIEEMMDIDWMSITHPDDVQADLDNMALLNAGKIPGFNMDKRYMRPDGSFAWINMTIAPLRVEQNISRHLCMIDDITERKQAEEEIRQLNNELEQRVAARTAQLEAANQELESFAYSVSHDLRVPLRAIDGFSRLVLKQYEGKLDDEGRRLLNVVRNNTKRMAQLIDDILAFSRAGRLEIKTAEADMEALAREAWQGLEASMEGRDVHLEIQSLPKAQGDPAMLRQVWANLLANAVKFTRPKPAARIEIEGKIEGTECVYCIRDNGVGFDQQYVHKLFGVFQRLHGVEEFEGTGIGLAIVKRIVTRHGGRVWAEGRVNEGAAFYFSLPRK